MRFKKIIVASIVVIAFFSSVIGVKAAIDWTVGHQNMQATADNIDKLVNRINTLKGEASQNQQELADLKNQLKSQQQQYQDLVNQKNNEEEALKKEIQQKIDEGNQKVAAKQQEVDQLNSKISDLNKQLDDKKHSEDNLLQDCKMRKI
ncbi:hypothetical protein [Leuconostoc citreum]|uniref:hypothetical protein n=1 Tax=Leuconostoc citreum TaxID=33964 RepID=UPI002182548D|nr:hypothetical protein [Leuconostoc citreum]